MSTIEWTDETWNPTVGCSRVSPGCDGCYAIGVAHRAMQPAHKGLTVMAPQSRGPRGGVLRDARPDWTGEVRLLPDRLDTPLHWRKPRRVFVDSMSDLFHQDVAGGFIADVFAVMAEAEQHTFQVLTKRPQRMARLLGEPDAFDGDGDEAIGGNGSFLAERNARLNPSLVARHGYVWPTPNVWLGTSVENQRYADLRIPHLVATPAAVRFLSVEPLLGPVDIGAWIGEAPDDPCAIDWVIVGGESGPGARPMHPRWVRDIRDQCVAAGVPFFFKQWGHYAPRTRGTASSGYPYVVVADDGTILDPTTTPADDPGVLMAVMPKKAAGRELDGRTWDEMPS